MTIELYPASVHNLFFGREFKYPRQVVEAAQQIHNACKGHGTDEQTLFAVLSSKSPEKRNLILLQYKELYHHSLTSLLKKSEALDNFKQLLRMISTPLAETEAQILRDAIKEMGSSVSQIIHVLAGRTTEEMTILKRAYFELVDEDLAVNLSSKLSGDFRKVVMAVLQSSQVPYNSAVHNAAKAEEKATVLYKAGQGRLGTDEETFIDILVKASPEFLTMIDAVYVARYKINITKAIDKEFSGDAKKSLNFLVRSTLDPYFTIAELFEKTFKGFETDESGLSTTLVRYQSLLPNVKAAYKRLYQNDLRDRITRKINGKYKNLFLQVFDAPQDPPRIKLAGLTAPHLPSPTEKNPPLNSSTPTKQQPHCQASQVTPVQTSYVLTSFLTQTLNSGGCLTTTPISKPAIIRSERKLDVIPSTFQVQETENNTALSYSSVQHQLASSGHQPLSLQHQQVSSFGQDSTNQPYQQLVPEQQQQQQPLPQQILNDENQGQTFQQYPELQHQPYSQSFQQYPAFGIQAPCQPYQENFAPGRQHLSNLPYPHDSLAQQQAPYPTSSYQQCSTMLGRQQQASYQQYQHYASPGQQPLGQTYQNLTGNEPQQYAVAQPPSYHPNQSQPYQQYSDPQQGYPASYGATFPPQEQLHQQQYGYSPYGS